MIISRDDCLIVSQNSNHPAWESTLFPAWVGFNAFYLVLDQKTGQGVEPHYHDGDEFWLFLSGHGEGWLDGEHFPIGANTLVYTPMGVVHRFQMFTDFATATVATRLEGRKRGRHILVEEDGPPERTAPGFVVPGRSNTGPVPQRGPRCPLSELRLLGFAAGTGLAEARLSVNEHWQVVEGRPSLTIDGLEVGLAPGDSALLRAGAVRRLHCAEGSQAVLVRE